jgi:hypothetical protein
MHSPGRDEERLVGWVIQDGRGVQAIGLGVRRDSLSASGGVAGDVDRRASWCGGQHNLQLQSARVMPPQAGSSSRYSMPKCVKSRRSRQQADTTVAGCSGSSNSKHEMVALHLVGDDAGSH